MANIPVDSAQTEVLLFIQTILACTSFDSCSFLFFLFVVASGGGMEALGDWDRGAQKWKVRGGTQQICNLLADWSPETESLAFEPLVYAEKDW